MTAEDQKHAPVALCERYSREGGGKEPGKKTETKERGLQKTISHITFIYTSLALPFTPSYFPPLLSGLLSL